MSTALRDTMIELPNFAYGWYAPLVSHEVTQKKIKGFNHMGKSLLAFRNSDRPSREHLRRRLYGTGFHITFIVFLLAALASPGPVEANAEIGRAHV